MSRLCILICRIDEEDGSGQQLTELACVAVPTSQSGPPGKQVDRLEEAAAQVGQHLLGHLVELQWEELDAQAVARYRQGRPEVVADGYQTLQVASRFGTLQLRRQVCAHPDGTHVLPGNALLPEHGGMLITRGLAEWACLLSQELPFASAARLLGWQAGEAGVLGARCGARWCATTASASGRSSTREPDACWSAAKRAGAVCGVCHRLRPGDDQGGRRP